MLQCEPKRDIKSEGKIVLCVINEEPHHGDVTPVLDGGEWSGSRPGRFNFGKDPWYLLDRRVSRSGRCKEEKYLLSFPGVKPKFLYRRARSLSLY
jgi:hypothetical protein